MKWLYWVVGIVVAVVLLVVAYQANHPSFTLRYRLSIDVETPEGVRSGSGVVEIWHRNQPQFLGQNPVVTRVRGEAVVVDLGQRGTLFALLTGRMPDGSPGQPTPLKMVLETLLPGQLNPWQLKTRYESFQGKPKGVEHGHIPFLVHFRDLGDPLTIETVDPENLAQRYGSGVSLMEVSLQLVPVGWWPLNRVGISGDPVTTGIEAKLPWLDRYYNQRLDGNRFGTIDATNRLANSLSAGVFKTGEF